jgi:hypothetical protein
MDETQDDTPRATDSRRRSLKPEPGAVKLQSLMTSLIAARTAMKEAPKKTATNPHFGSKYATLDEVLDAVMPHLLANGLFLMQVPIQLGQRMVLSSILWHAPSREVMDCGEYDLGPVPITNPQMMGSAITYARRYTMQCIAGVAAEEDDDGAVATRPAQPTRPAAAPARPATRPAASTPARPAPAPARPAPAPAAARRVPVDAEDDFTVDDDGREAGDLADDEVLVGDERWEKQRKRFFSLLKSTLAGTGVAWKGQRYSSMNDVERRQYICDVLKRDVMTTNDLTLADWKAVNNFIDIGMDPTITGGAA